MKGPSRTDRWRVLVNEADALRRQSLLLHRWLRPQNVDLQPSAGDADVVFLLHGVLATAGVFVPLVERLRAAGVAHIASFTYHPLRTIPSLARELGRACEAIPKGTRLHLVGHSLGGVVARYYVQEEGGAARVTQTLSLASPFFGTTMARLVPTAMARQLAPSSPLLARLRDPVRAMCGVPHTSVVAAGDMVVTPPTSAAFPFGEVFTFDDLGHNALLFDRRVADLVYARVTSPVRDDVGQIRTAVARAGGL